MRYFSIRLSVAACLLLSSSGCDGKRDVHVCSFPAGKENTIVPGCGIASSYVGMSVSDLQGDWKLLTNPVFEGVYLDNISAGIGIKQLEGQITAVFFYYTADGFQPFAGKAQRNIGAKSSIEETIQAYGQPRSMSAFINSRGVEIVDLDYGRLGIMFFFEDQVLKHICTLTPSNEVDPVFPGDIGDTSKYRAIPVGK